MNTNHVEAMKKIFPKATIFHQHFEVLVSGSDDTHINFDRRMPTHGIEFTIGQHTQQTGLSFRRHIAYFI